MWRHSSFVIVGTLALSASSFVLPASAQIAGRGIVSASAARRVDLERPWSAQVAISSARDRVQFMTFRVSNRQSFTVFEIAYGDRTVFYSERQLGPFGQPLGVQAAQRRAEDLIETQRALGQKAEIVTRTVAESTLVLQSTLGVVTAIDGESGRTRWVTEVGDANSPNMAPAASEDYVVTINGSRLYLLNAADGAVLWDRALEGIPGAGPAISGPWVFVPVRRGAVEAYAIERPTESPQRYGGSGRAIIQPTVSPLGVSWPSEDYLYVSSPDRLAPRFRLETRQPIEAASAHLPPDRLFTVTIGGHVYALNEASGDILWRSSLGQTVRQAPVPMADALYVITAHAGMYRLAAETGQLQWTVPGIRQFVAASQTRVYGKTASGTIVVLDATSGQTVGHLIASGIDLALTNRLTDRLYVGNTSGVIQCLHETQLNWPLRHVTEPSEDEAKVPQQGEEVVPGQPPVAQDGQAPPPAAPARDAAEDPFQLQPGQDEDKPIEADEPIEAGEEPDPFGPSP